MERKGTEKMYLKRREKTQQIVGKGKEMKV